MDLPIMKRARRCTGVAALLLWPLVMHAQKVEICHTPPTDPDNVHTIEVERNGLREHLDHGDYLGPCKEDEESYFSVKVAPNPYYERTNINYSLYEPATIQMVIYDQIGKRVKILVDADLEPGKYSHEFSTLDLGISHGVYFLKVMRKTADKEFLHFERLVDLH